MTNEYLLEQGYREYPKTPFDDEYIIARFQKRFDDDFGKKYFINVLRWSNDYIPVSHRGSNWEPYGYEYEIYFSMYEEEKSLKLKFFNSWTLEEVEDFAEDFFDKMNPNYYESWDENRGGKTQIRKG